MPISDLKLLFTPTNDDGLGRFYAELFFNSLKISLVKWFCIDLIDAHWCNLLDRELNTNKLNCSNICQWGTEKFEAIIKQNLPCISSFFRQWVKFKTVLYFKDFIKAQEAIAKHTSEKDILGDINGNEVVTASSEE